MVRFITVLALITVLAGTQSATAYNNEPKSAHTLKTVVVKPDVTSGVQFFSNSSVNEVKFRYDPSQFSEPVTVRILKSSGVQLQAFTLSASLTKLRTHTLKPGVYEYRCVTADGKEITSGSFTVTH
jgi:hypothetical protein